MARLLVPVLALFLLVSGCSRDAPQGPSTVTSAPIPADPSATEDVPGVVACRALAGAIRDATLLNPGVVDAIAAAASTADAPVADAGRRLAEAYRVATAARDTDGEPDAVAAVSAAGADMTRVCAESGLDTVG